MSTVVLPAHRTLEQVLNGSGPRRFTATVLSGPLEGEALPIIGGSISADQGNDSRTGSVEVARDSDAVVDALDVRSRTELLIRAEVRMDDKSWQGWDLGVMHATSRPLVAGDDRISVSIADRASWVKLAGMRERYVAQGGSSIAQSVLAVMGLRAPWLPVVIDDDPGYTFPDVGGVLGEPGKDPWALCVTLARSLGMDLRVDPSGVCRMVKVTEPLSKDVAQTWATGEDGVLESAELSGLEDADIVNVVGVPWQEESPDSPPEGYVPAAGTVYAEDQTSPLGIDAMGERYYHYGGDVSIITSSAQAQDVAASELIVRQGAAETVSCARSLDPRVDIGTVVYAVAPSARIDHVMRVQSLSIGFDGWGMGATLGVRRQGA